MQASLTFTTPTPVGDDGLNEEDRSEEDPSEEDSSVVEPIASESEDAEGELAATGGRMATLTLVALLALLVGAATLTTTRISARGRTDAEAG